MECFSKRGIYKRLEHELDAAHAAADRFSMAELLEGSKEPSANPHSKSNSDGFIIENSSLGTGARGREDDKEAELFANASRFFQYDADQHELDDELGFADPSNPPVRGWNLRFLQWKIRRFVENFVVRVLTALFIIVDMVLLIIDLCSTPTTANSPLEYCALAFSIYFFIEILLRIFGLGLRLYFRKWYNSTDFFIVMLTLTLSILMVIIEDMDSSPANLLVAFRMIRLLRISRILWQRRQIQTGARQFISQNKRRYQQDGFDLDLTYVAPRIIAMSFPSSGRMSLYRNDIKEVARFFNTKHKGHYKIYNLCSEKDYDTTGFGECVQRFWIDDHNVPSLKEMVEFSENVHQWMSDDEENVIAVHCKGGKGRTGTMICVVLIDTGLFHDSSHCLSYFGDRRTDRNVGRKFQGVETPSQSRYVEYYEQIVKVGRKMPEELSLVITGFTIRGIRHVGGGDGSDFSLSIRSRFHSLGYEASLQTQQNCKVIHSGDQDAIHIELMNAPVIKGDTKVMFLSHNKKIPKGYDNCPFYFWFHTGFLNDNKLELRRHELDNPHKPKTWNVFTEDFCVITLFNTGSLSNQL